MSGNKQFHASYWSGIPETGFTHILFRNGLLVQFSDDELFPAGQIRMVIVDNLMDRTSDDWLADLLVATAKIAPGVLKGNFPLSTQKIHVLK